MAYRHVAQNVGLKRYAPQAMIPPAISWTPVMQYHRDVRTACSRCVYHMVAMIMKVGWTHDSNIPSRKRTIIKDLKSFAAAEQTMIAPQRNTLHYIAIIRNAAVPIWFECKTHSKIFGYRQLLKK